MTEPQTQTERAKAFYESHTVKGHRDDYLISRERCIEVMAEFAAVEVEAATRDLREQRKSSNVLFAEKVKREIGMCCPDPWRTVLIERIDGIVYEAIKANEGKG
jgi:hypothetical protein